MPPAANQYMLTQPGKALDDPLVELVVADEAVPVLVGGGEARVIGSGLDLHKSRQQLAECRPHAGYVACTKKLMLAHRLLALPQTQLPEG
jgi:hypothetical protein